MKKKRKRNGSPETASKKKKYVQKNKESYGVLWPCLGLSKKGEHMVHCSVCNSDFSCGHAGKNDFYRHIMSKQHKDLSKLKESNTSMKTFVGVPSTELNRQRAITRAETMLAELITELNLPLTSSDTFNKAVKLMFPDSKIAEGIYSLYFLQVVSKIYVV